MKNDFPRLEVSDSLRRRMVEVAREFRKRPTDLESQRDNFSSPALGQGQAGGK